jgi:hypothetical protein
VVVYVDVLQSANALRKATVSYLHKFYAATGDASPQVAIKAVIGLSSLMAW